MKKRIMVLAILLCGTLAFNSAMEAKAWIEKKSGNDTVCYGKLEYPECKTKLGAALTKKAVICKTMTDDDWVSTYGSYFANASVSVLDAYGKQLTGATQVSQRSTDINGCVTATATTTKVTVSDIKKCKTRHWVSQYNNGIGTCVGDTGYTEYTSGY